MEAIGKGATDGVLLVDHPHDPHRAPLCRVRAYTGAEACMATKESGLPKGHHGSYRKTMILQQRSLSDSHN